MVTIGVNASFLRKPATGIGQVAVNVVKTLARTHHLRAPWRNASFSLYVDALPKTPLSLPENMHIAAISSWWRRDDLVRTFLWEKYLLPWKVRKDHCDVLVSLAQSATVAPRGVLHIMVVHDVIPKLFPAYLNNARKRYYYAQCQKAIARADHIIAVSRRTEKDLIQHLGIPAEKISVNYIAPSPLFHHPVTDAEKAHVIKKYHLPHPYIYTGGGLEVRKNTDGVLRAYRMLRDEQKKRGEQTPHLVISGKLLPQLAPLVVDVEALVKKLNLTPFVHILDFVPEEDLPGLYAGALFFLYPAHYEGFGLPLLEAMSVGTPVVSAKTSSLPEIGRDAALYCNPADDRDLMMVMRTLLQNHALRDTLRMRGTARAAQFSWEAFVEKTLAIIEHKMHS